MENRKRNEPRKNGARFEVPLLVPSDNLMISHRIFRSEFETDDYLLDAFELFNETDEAVEYPVLPLVSINLWILMPESGPKVYLSGPLTFMHMVVVPKQTVLYCLRLRPETSRQILQIRHRLTRQILQIRRRLTRKIRKIRLVHRGRRQLSRRHRHRLRHRPPATPHCRQ